MGFPDPSPKDAIGFYNQVVAECNKPLNATVWLVRLERTVPGLIQTYTVLLREFQNAVPPLISVVNNFGNFSTDRTPKKGRLHL